jgi:hypothetical protein
MKARLRWLTARGLLTTAAGQPVTAFWRTHASGNGVTQCLYDPGMTLPRYPSADQVQLGAPGRSTVIAPALVAGGVGLVLGTAGNSLVGFGIATSCTDEHETVHGCDGMYRWLGAGVIGQWALVITAIILLAVGLGRPASRKAIAISLWAIIPLAVAWFAFYMYSARRAF